MTDHPGTDEPARTGDESAAKTDESKKPDKPNVLSQLWRSLVAGDEDADSQKRRCELVKSALEEVVADVGVASKYNIMLMFDEGTLIRVDADSIYRTIRNFKEKKDILLVLYSGGGRIEPAYLIGQLCREYATDKFVVVVPRGAKSAATLICCAADQVHLGSMSELGPIDPQIGDYPALGLGNALRHIAELVSQNPGASSMFAEYLSLTVPPIDLGYYERVAESAVQYAEKLLSLHDENLSSSPEEIAKRLVYSYKDHGFVIDKQEATNIFGDKMIECDSEEYNLGNAIYDRLDLIKQWAKICGYHFWWVGSQFSDCVLMKKKTADRQAG